MEKFTYVITDPAGIHARPAGLLVKEAGKFISKLTISKSAKKGDLKRIFGVMALGVKKGEEIEVTCEGADEAAAASALAAFFKANL